MQGRGEINSPRPFCCWARRVLAQPSLLGRVWPRREYFWAEIGPIHFWPTSAHHCFGLSPAQWFGPAQPDLILYLLYIYIIFCIIYIYIYIYIYTWKNYKNYAKIIEKYMWFCCNFITVFWLILVGILYCKDTNPVLTYPVFIKTSKIFKIKNFFCFQKFSKISLKILLIFLHLLYKSGLIFGCIFFTNPVLKYPICAKAYKNTYLKNVLF